MIQKKIITLRAFPDICLMLAEIFANVDWGSKNRAAGMNGSPL